MAYGSSGYSSVSYSGGGVIQQLSTLVKTGFYEVLRNGVVAKTATYVVSLVSTIAKSGRYRVIANGYTEKYEPNETDYGNKYHSQNSSYVDKYP